MFSIEKIRLLLEDANLKKVSDKSGISLGTIYRIVNKPDHQASYESVKALSDYLEEKRKLYSDQ
jgi:hypothetical protein